MAPNNRNTPSSAVSYFTPAQVPAAGTALKEQSHVKEVPLLFKPIKIRGLEFHNRIFLSPLCQYSAEDGKLTDWHFAHLGGILTRGPGLTFVEATAVTPEGRITPEDSGIWSDDHIAPLKRIVDFAHSQNQKMAIQLAHAGRKASTSAPWIQIAGGDVLATEEVGGWPDDVWGPSDVPFSEAYPKVKALTKEGIEKIKKAFVDGAKRSLAAGFDVIEIHNAHGYLLSSFLSPTSNKRTDEYGGSFENRIRLSLEIADAIRAVIPDTMPLFLRVSGTEWLQDLEDVDSWKPEDTVRFAKALIAHGVDLIDVSSGGIDKRQKVIGGKAYQAFLAHEIKKKLSSDEAKKLTVATVGAITDGPVAQEILDEGQADIIIVGRQFQKNPGTVWEWADELGVDVKKAFQIEWGFHGRTARKAKEAEKGKDRMSVP